MALLHHRRSDLLAVIVVGSIAGNALLWYGLSRGANQVVSSPSLPELVVERVTIEKTNPAEPQKVTFRPAPPKAISKLVTPPPIVHEKEPPIFHKQATPPPPQGAHNKVLLAKPTPTAPAPSNFHALSGGQAKLGAATSAQNGGNATQNPPQPPAPVPPSTTLAPSNSTPTPPTPTPPVHHDELPAPVVLPKKEDPPAPAPPPPPKPKGLTQDAVATSQVNPEIPESLKSQTFKSHVRVRVSIAADGSFEVTLRTSSGNTDIDKLVLNALDKWKWKPALKDGEVVDSVQLFRFDFSVE